MPISIRHPVPSLSVPPGAAAVLFCVPREGEEPRIYVASRNPGDEHWPDTLQFGPAGKVRESPMVRALREGAHASTTNRLLLSVLNPIYLGAQQARNLIVQARRKNILERMRAELEKRGLKPEDADAIAEATERLSHKIVFLPESVMRALRREGAEEANFLRLSENDVLGYSPLALVTPHPRQAPGTPEFINAYFYLIHLTEQGMNDLVQHGGSGELQRPHYRTLSEVKSLQGRRRLVQPHFRAVIPLLDTAIKGAMERSRGVSNERPLFKVQRLPLFKHPSQPKTQIIAPRSAVWQKLADWYNRTFRW